MTYDRKVCYEPETTWSTSSGLPLSEIYMGECISPRKEWIDCSSINSQKKKKECSRTIFFFGQANFTVSGSDIHQIAPKHGRASLHINWEIPLTFAPSFIIWAKPGARGMCIAMFCFLLLYSENEWKRKFGWIIHNNRSCFF